MSVRVGLVGFGYAGATIHAPLISAEPALELTKIATLRPDDVVKSFANVLCVSDAAALFAASDIDVVVLATPNLTHFALAEQALRAGKHVVIDKPMAITSAEGNALIELARKQNKILTVFQNRRWDGDFLTVRQLLRNNVLGEVRDFESRFDRYRPEVRVRWREDDLPGSGSLYDLGPHLIDQALLLFGKPRRLLADLRIERVDAKTTDAFDLVMDYGRHRARLRASMLVAQPSPRFRIEGSVGGFSKYGTDGQEEQLKRGERPGAVQWGEDNPDMFGTLTTVEAEKRADQRVRTERGAYEVFYRQLAEAIDSNATVPVDPIEANLVIRVIEAAMQSHQSGHWIDFA